MIAAPQGLPGGGGEAQWWRRAPGSPRSRGRTGTGRTRGARRPLRAPGDGRGAGGCRCHVPPGGDAVLIRTDRLSSNRPVCTDWTPSLRARRNDTARSTSDGDERHLGGEEGNRAGRLQGLPDARQCDRPGGGGRHRRRVHEHRELGGQGHHQPDRGRLRHEGPGELLVLHQGHLRGGRRRGAGHPAPVGPGPQRGAELPDHRGRRLLPDGPADGQDPREARRARQGEGGRPGDDGGQRAGGAQGDPRPPRRPAQPLGGDGHGNGSRNRFGFRWRHGAHPPPDRRRAPGSESGAAASRRGSARGRRRCRHR